MYSCAIIINFSLDTGVLRYVRNSVSLGSLIALFFIVSIFQNEENVFQRRVLILSTGAFAIFGVVYTIVDGILYTLSENRIW